MANDKHLSVPREQSGRGYSEAVIPRQTRAIVVMATHAPDSALLAAQVRSLQEQTFQNWHCVVYDDCSPDRARVAQAFAGDDRFTLLDGGEHLGHNLAFEKLLSTVSPAELPVFLCDQDDVWHPKKMDMMLEEIECGATAVFSAMRVVDPDGHLIRERFLPQDPHDHWLRPASLLRMNCVSGTSMAVAPETLRSALPFPDMRLRGWHDQWLAAVASRRGRLVYLHEPLTDYTQHGGQVMGDGLRSVNWERLRKFVVERRTPDQLLADLRSRVDWIALAATRLLAIPGDPDEELRCLAERRLSQSTLSWLWDGVRQRDTPMWRTMLLSSGYMINAVYSRFGSKRPSLPADAVAEAPRPPAVPKSQG